MSDNELIAEFMGLVFVKEIDGIKYYDVPKGTFNMHNASMGYFLYHKSWDWLMPVVEKINRMDKMVTINYYTDAHVTVTKIYSWNLGDNVHEDEFEEEKAIDSVYKAVVNFIKWYNQQGVVNE